MTRILVIDDDALLRKSIRIILERAGYEVSEAADGAAGLRLYGEQRADLVLTDMLMPERDGLEVIRGLRADTPRPKIVAMSGGGLAQIDVLEVAAALGATHTLRKPFHPHELLKVIADALGESGLPEGRE